VIAAEVFIAFVESPGDGKAGDDAAQKIFGLVSAQDRGGERIKIVLARGSSSLSRCVLPVFPVEDVMLAKFVE
jgi:hypothetical protein